MVPIRFCTMLRYYPAYKYHIRFKANHRCVPSSIISLSYLLPAAQDKDETPLEHDYDGRLCVYGGSAIGWHRNKFCGGSSICCNLIREPYRKYIFSAKWRYDQRIG